MAKTCTTWNGVQNIGTKCLDKKRIKTFVKKLYEIAERHHITITELSVMPDHVHAVVGILTTMSISQAFHLLKGASSRDLFKQKPTFRRRYLKGHFWSPGKFYRTVGDADAETVINYVRQHQFRQTTLNAFSSTTKPAK